MASIRERPPTGRNKGRKPSYAVLYRSPAGKQTSLTVPDRPLAERLKRWLEADGEEVALERLRKHLQETHGATVADLVEAYLEWKLPRVRSDRTVADYRRDYANHIKPALGERVADQVSADDIQEWIDELEAKLSAKTIANVYGSVLAPAYKWGRTRARPRLVETNPCEGVDPPKVRKGAPKGLRADEWPLLYQAAAETYPDAADLLLFLVGTGWRWSEAVALDAWQVEEVKTDDNVAVIIKVGQVVRRNAAGEHVIVRDAKSEAGYERALRLSPAVGDMVLRRARDLAADDPVFTSDTGIRWRYNNFYHRYWARTKPPKGKRPDSRPRIRERAGNHGLRRADEITPHWLRHTNVAMLDRAGASMPEIQRRIGHEKITTTIDVYGRGIDDTTSEVLAALDRQLIGRPRLRAVE